MRIRLLSGVAGFGIWMAFGPVWAQQNPSVQNPGVVRPQDAQSKDTQFKDTQSRSEAPPLPGANSFVEGQARKLLESKGYSGVSSLVNDSQGIWRGTAMSGSNKVHVSVDYKGNVTAHP